MAHREPSYSQDYNGEVPGSIAGIDLRCSKSGKARDIAAKVLGLTIPETLWRADEVIEQLYSFLRRKTAPIGTKRRTVMTQQISRKRREADKPGKGPAVKSATLDPEPT